MTVTQNVVMDLLPVYLSGEASPDTRELIEEFLRQDPELARVVAVQMREFNSQRDLLEPAGAPSTDHELRRTPSCRWLDPQHW